MSNKTNSQRLDALHDNMTDVYVYGMESLVKIAPIDEDNPEAKEFKFDKDMITFMKNAQSFLKDNDIKVKVSKGANMKKLSVLIAERDELLGVNDGTKQA